MSTPAAVRHYILVVDDDDDIRFIVGMFLEGEGYAVRTASDGQEALDTIRQAMPQLVLLDLKMPGMNGWEFVERFREQYPRRPPIIVMSAIDDIGRRAGELGADAFLAKPFDASDLTAIVRRHVA